MGKPLEHTRLTTRDVEELSKCLTRLDQIHDSVNATGMAGKIAVMGLCVEVYRVIESLLSREMALVRRWQEQTKGTVAGGDGQEEV